MPIVSIEMFEGRTEKQKAEIVDTFQRELSRILDGKHGPIEIKFVEIPCDINHVKNSI